MLDEKIESEILALAFDALAQDEAERAEKIYTDIILKLKQSLDNNQKEMAAALQGFARRIENKGEGDSAFRFKQRTCEVMLKVSMAERHAGRSLPALPPAAAPAARRQVIRSPFAALYFSQL